MVTATGSEGAEEGGHAEVVLREPWTKALLSDTRDVVGRLLGERLVDVGSLRLQVHAYRQHVMERAGPMTDLRQAKALCAATLALLDRTSDGDRRARKLAQVAARYFVLRDDGDDDLSSPYGFDDDVEVFNAVVRELGESHHEIPY